MTDPQKHPGFVVLFTILCLLTLLNWNNVAWAAVNTFAGKPVVRLMTTPEPVHLPGEQGFHLSTASCADHLSGNEMPAQPGYKAVEHTHRHITAAQSTEVVNGYKIVRGERPPINFNTKDTTAWHQNVLIIKFQGDFEQHLKNNPPHTNKEGITTFGLAAVDSLNARYSIRSASQYFLSPALHNTFTDRHKAWGFHLWYRLETKAKTDILQMMDGYAKLPEIEITSPSFIKVLHQQDGVPPEDGQTPNTTRLPHRETKAEEQQAGDGNSFPSGTTLSKNGNTIDRNDEWVPDDPLFWSQWAFKNTGQYNGRPGSDIDLTKALEIEKGDTTVIVAVVDGGIDLDHEDIAGNIWYQTGYNFVHNSPVIEPHNHGTLVAGIIGATNNNNTGVASIAGGSGQNDGPRLMTAQVFAESGTGGFHTAQVYAADNGAAITQNSWGYSEPGYYNPAILDAFDYFNAHGGGAVMEGGIVFSSAGNSNDNDAYYPGYYSGVFSVTGTGNRDEKAWYSNYGSYIDIAAPGGETNTVSQRGVHTTYLNDNYGYSQGTSVACPFVSGTAALLLSYAYRNNHILANSEVRAFLKENTDNINTYNPNYHDLLGSGRLNAHKVLLAAQHTLGNVTNPGHFVSAVSPDDYEITLSWTRNPAMSEVMIVWAVNDSLGRPENGISYQTGDYISGGGQVLFRGSDTLYTHQELDEHTSYHYKAFSYDGYYEYSHGRTTSATTSGGNLLVTGLNKGYSNIPISQLPDNIQLKAKVQNTGLRLTRESHVLFTVKPSEYSDSTNILLPFNTGDETEVVAEDPWHTAGLQTGSYHITWEADHRGSNEEDKIDGFVLNISDSLYARDSGNIRQGMGSSTGPITLGMPYEIHKPAIFRGVQIQWPDNNLTALDFRVVLFKINDAMEITGTALMSDLLTRTPEMQNTVHSYMFDNQSITVEPGNYMLAFKQLSGENLMVGFDAEPLGSFYRSDQAVDPSSFPHQHYGYGHLALRIILTEAENTSSAGHTNDNPGTPDIWVYNNILYINNPHGAIQVAVLDISGRRLLKFPVQGGINSFPLNLPAGIYFITTDSRNSIKPTKIIIH
jgi:subtilisin family serine protease